MPPPCMIVQDGLRMVWRSLPCHSMPHYPRSVSWRPLRRRLVVFARLLSPPTSPRPQSPSLVCLPASVPWGPSVSLWVLCPLVALCFPVGPSGQGGPSVSKGSPLCPCGSLWVSVSPVSPCAPFPPVCACGSLKVPLSLVCPCVSGTPHGEQAPEHTLLSVPLSHCMSLRVPGRSLPNVPRLQRILPSIPTSILACCLLL